ncbi:MAG TPA: protein translocase subunit SecD [Gordonia sp. (in: high G+C Gram-positive bacteria)]|uniref:protein translocase subunit SecD n=1 Tax=unclassified Gordonia (in: high G+C Gram-positive bacteria) TaxID=2657482 RepID=UPI000FAA5491|nr:MULTISPECIES: protein translocase subunit SecD [unclassified Gordonia (in: high G+C Gram-positive bacteria)]RUP35759.1 MAG: protein translocase subunit SecD [Gordonia sp. (in: high G+C Gram-positive bacteria)]HNP57751.1 protein translocase subunit SecD [Gordonia sp. (in: high G+C Gram-positive bacteria)]HRC50441.1 protein translocase subunit SecD [Gordonia sp. (in: high G+C Gram-positive bacteria)]
MTTPRRPAAKRARPTRETPPWQPLLAFLALLAIVFGLVFFTSDRDPEPKLGIDLQGGTRVTLTARTPDGKRPSRDQLDKAKQIISQRVDGLGVAGSEVVVSGDNLIITVPGDDGRQARNLGQTARLYIRPVAKAPNGQGVVMPAPQQKKPQTGAEEVPNLTPEQQREAVAEQRKLRQAPKDASPQQIAALQAYMLKMNCDPKAHDPLLGNDDPESYLVACSTDGKEVYLLEPMIIDGRDIASASANLSPQTNQWTVGLDFKGAAQKLWPTYTAQNRGTQTAMTLDSRVVSAPVIQSTITGSTEISGGQNGFSEIEARDLANVLKYGSLPLSFEASDAETVSSTLGLSALRAGLLAGLVGLIAVLLYALAYYRMLGVLTFASLVLAGAMSYGLIVLLGRWIGFTLDLAGVAGFIIGIGMTADSFVVYFERIKDEMREGRSFRSAVPRGWASARRTVWTGNAVSLIASVVIYVLAVGSVRGFAFALGLTTILDVMVVFLVTHPLVVLATRSPFLSKPSVNGLGAVSEVARQRREAARAAVGLATGDEASADNGTTTAAARGGQR